MDNIYASLLCFMVIKIIKLKLKLLKLFRPSRITNILKHIPSQNYYTYTTRINYCGIKLRMF